MDIVWQKDQDAYINAQLNCDMIFYVYIRFNMCC
jgi:hypothetical protein